jgi:hypothetical protein
VVIQVTTFIVFPLLGLLILALTGPLLSSDLRLGVFYLCALPSTVSSSIAFTAAARGNVPSAVFNATLSGLLGVFLTPLWIGLLLTTAGHALPLGRVIGDLALWLLLPLALGQAARPIIGSFITAHRRRIGLVDRATILLLVYTSFADSFQQGVWSEHGFALLAGLSVVEDVASSEFVVRSTSTAGALVPGARRLVEERTLALPGPGTDVDVNGWGQVLVSFSATPAERSFEINEAEKQGRFPDPSTRSGAALIDVPTFSLGRAFVGGHRGFTVTGALSPDGRVVVTGGWDRRVIVWDARTGEFVTERSLAWLVRRVRVAPTGDRVAVAAWTPVSVDGDSEPALLLYPLELADVSIAAKP